MLLRSLFVFFLSLNVHAYNQIYVFGDSLSDQGNACPQSRYKKRYLCHLYPGGKFTEGLLWIEHLSQHLNLELKPSHLGGNNYAFGGATSDWGTETTPGLLQQIQQYLRQTDSKIIPGSLYVIWIGGNDLKNRLLDFSLISYAETFFLEDVLHNVSNAVGQLARAGAKNFLIPNLVPLHRVPVSQKILSVVGNIFSGMWTWMSEKDNDENEISSMTQKMLSFQVSSYINEYNWKLSLRLKKLEERYSIQIFHHDTLHFLETVYKYPALYGVEDLDDFFYFDGFHPSAKGHKVLGDEFISFLPSL